jgi:hypothetical protein
MTVPAPTLGTSNPARLRAAELASTMMVALAGSASAAGLFVPGLYSEVALEPAMRGQDLVTLACLPVLLAAMRDAARGSPRAAVIWLGLAGYVLYTYVGAAFAYRFNELFLVYVAIFSLSLAVVSLLLLAIAPDVEAVRFERPRRLVAGFAIFVALMLLVSELAQIVPALATRTVPELIRRSEGAGNFVYALDLGVVAPLSVLAAVLLWKRKAWGRVLAGVILIKALTMGLALLSMTLFSVRAGQPLEAGLTAAYGVMAGAALALSIAFLREPAATHDEGRERAVAT